MRLEMTEQLSPIQKAAITELVADCRSYENLTLSFPFEDAAVTWFLWEGSHLSAVFALLSTGTDAEEPAEACAFTHPSRRRKGYFSRLFHAAEAQFQDRDLVFLVDNHSPAALSVLESLGAEPESEELRMEYHFSSAPEVFASESGEKSPARLICRETREAETVTRYDFFLPGEAKPAALCRTMAFGSRSCFYDFLVEETLRGKGFGKEALFTVLSSLRQKNCSTVFLHVSGDNLPAVSLYKKTGFRICETLSLYLY